jgi:hypothetical protein
MWWHNISQIEVLVRWVKWLVCCCGDEGWILSNGILNFVLNDYNMIIRVLNYYKMITYIYIYIYIGVNPCGHYT